MKLNNKSLTVAVLLILFLFLAGCSKESETDKNQADINGNWNGTIDIPGHPLTIGINFDETEELTGTISIPVQRIENYPLSKIKLDEEHLVFTMEMQGEVISFDGEVADGRIEGTFSQQGQTFPFKLEKGELAQESDDESGEFLSIETEAGEFYGELEMPESEGPHPVFIIIPGSGPTDRNGNSLAGENNSLKMIAEELAEYGIASIRYDKPGAGKNTELLIPEEEMTFEHMAHYAALWVDLAQEDDRFTKVGIAGHSQGSLEGILAAQQTNIDAFISLAGGGSSIDNVLLWQLEQQLPKDLMKESEDILMQLKEGNQVEEMSPELESLFRPSVQPFLISWIAYTPAKEVGEITSPVLVVNGGHDLQVPLEEGEILSEGNDRAEYLVIDEMNHVLKDAPENGEENIKTYADPTLPLADGLMDGIIEFLQNNDFITD